MDIVWKREACSPYREDGALWSLTVCGQRVGEIQSYVENAGGPSPRWLVACYESRLLPADSRHDVCFEVSHYDSKPHLALAAAKTHLLGLLLSLNNEGCS